MCTSGDAGSEDPAISVDELVRIREEEQYDGRPHPRAGGVHYLRYPDGELEPTLEVRKAIVRVMRQLERTSCCARTRGRWSTKTARTSTTPITAPQARPRWTRPSRRPATRAPIVTCSRRPPPHKVREIWLYFTSGQNVNHWVDISETMEPKLQALEAHASQLGDWAGSVGCARHGQVGRGGVRQTQTGFQVRRGVPARRDRARGAPKSRRWRRRRRVITRAWRRPARA